MVAKLAILGFVFGDVGHIHGCDPRLFPTNKFVGWGRRWPPTDKSVGWRNALGEWKANTPTLSHTHTQPPFNLALGWRGNARMEGHTPTPSHFTLTPFLILISPSHLSEGLNNCCCFCYICSKLIKIKDGNSPRSQAYCFSSTFY